jgi:hypothetical protein
MLIVQFVQDGRTLRAEVPDYLLCKPLELLSERESAIIKMASAWQAKHAERRSA